jgi:uncharacterized protein with PQ loop repeat
MKEQKSINKLEFLTWIAGILITISFTDLVYNVYRTQNTASLSYSWIFLLITAQLLYFIFGLVNDIEGIFIPSLIIILMVSYIFYVKYFSIKNT